MKYLNDNRRRSLQSVLLAIAGLTAMAVQLPAHAKPYAPNVTMVVTPAGQGSIGQALPVTIEFTAAAGGAEVSFSTDPGLALSQAGKRTLPAGKTSLTILATPSANGRKLINVFVRQGRLASATAIGVQVGPEAPASSRKAMPITRFGERPARFQPIP